MKKRVRVPPVLWPRIKYAPKQRVEIEYRGIVRPILLTSAHHTVATAYKIMRVSALERSKS